MLFQNRSCNFFYFEKYIVIYRKCETVTTDWYGWDTTGRHYLFTKNMQISSVIWPELPILLRKNMSSIFRYCWYQKFISKQQRIIINDSKSFKHLNCDIIKQRLYFCSGVRSLHRSVQFVGPDLPWCHDNIHITRCMPLF